MAENAGQENAGLENAGVSGKEILREIQMMEIMTAPGNGCPLCRSWFADPDDVAAIQLNCQITTNTEL